MTGIEIEEYYNDLRRYYLSLPFNWKKVKTEERHYRSFSFLFNIFAVMRRTVVLNREELTDENGVIFVSNHIGSYDQFYIARLLKKKRLIPHYLVKEKVISFFFRWNFIYKHTGVVVVNQKSIKSWQDAKQELAKYLLHKRNVFIFPEGTRRGEENIGDFSSSVAQLAQETGAKVVTMAIKNSAKLFQKRPIICAGQTVEVGATEDIRTATERIKTAVLGAYSEIEKYERELK